MIIKGDILAGTLGRLIMIGNSPSWHTVWNLVYPSIDDTAERQHHGLRFSHRFTMHASPTCEGTYQPV